HPEQGEEAFLVDLTDEGEVRLRIRAFSRPASLLARAGGPVTRLIQQYATDRYVRAIRRLAQQRDRRGLVAALLLLTSSVWAAGSAPAGDRAAPLDPISQRAAAEIRAARPAGYPVGGLDISHHDHRYFAPHWRTEVAAGSQFVYIKATEGSTYVNPNFTSDYTAARAAGRYVGAYVFARPDLGRPVEQAEYFLNHARFTRDRQTL